MDREIAARLSAAGVTGFDGTNPPTIPIALDENRNPATLGDEVPVSGPNDEVITVTLRPISALFSGTKVPPSFSDGPTAGYEYFFLMIEQTAVNFCATTKRIERDADFEAIYNHLRRRPDGKHVNPIFSYLRAAVRLYMSLNEVSQAEFEAVVDRLRRSAKHFALNATTSNYYQLLRNQFGLADGKETSWPLNQLTQG